MSAPRLNWERVAAEARKAAESGGAEPQLRATAAREAELARRIAARAMKTASLGSPGFGAVISGWVVHWKFWILAGVLGVVVMAPLAGRMFQPPREVRVQNWSFATLRQLRAWHPMSCEEAGGFNIRMQRAVARIQALPAGSPEAAATVREAVDGIAEELTPAEKQAFLQEQERLRKRWLWGL